MILVGLVNNVHDAIARAWTPEVIGKAINHLFSYTALHFQHEESLMQEAAYPRFPEHKAQHDTLAQRVQDLRRRFAAGEAGVGDDLVALLKDWLVQHIQGTDKRFGEYLATLNAAAGNPAKERPAAA